MTGLMAIVVLATVTADIRFSGDVRVINETPRAFSAEDPNHWLHLVDDFDGNGLGDVVFPVSAAAKIAYQQAPGEFVVDAPLLFQSYLAIESGDLNADGYADLVVSQPHELQIYSGGPGGVGSTPVTRWSGGSQAAPIGIGDVDGDGDLEIVARGWVLDADGFDLQPRISIGLPLGELHMADHDGDGNDEIFDRAWIIDVVDTVRGTAIVESRILVDGSQNVTRRLRRVVDMNGDGRPDVILVAFAFAQRATIAYGQADGTFSAVHVFTLGENTDLRVDADAADFNGDGRMDLVLLQSGESPPDFRTQPILYTQSVDGDFPTSRLVHMGGLSPSFVEAVDVDGDQLPDLLTDSIGALFPSNGQLVNVGSNLSVSRNDDGWIGAPAVFPGMNQIGGGGPASVGAADLNGDGLRDLFTSTYGEVRVMIGLDDESFLDESATFMIQPVDGHEAVATRLRPELGRDDLAYIDEDGNVSTLLGMPTTITPSGFAMLPGPVATIEGTPSEIAVVHDRGVPTGDIVVLANIETARGTQGRLHVLRSAGGGMLSVVASLAFEEQLSGLEVGDLNGDELDDVAVATFGTWDAACACPNEDAYVYALINTGSEFTIVGDRVLVAPVIFDLAITDANGDRRPDIVTVGTRSDVLSVVVQAEDGSFEPGWSQVLPFDPWSIEAGDLDGDGIGELVISPSGPAALPPRNPEDARHVAIFAPGPAGYVQIGAHRFSDSPLALSLTHVNDDELLDLVVGMWLLDATAIAFNRTAQRCVGDINGDLLVNFADLDALLDEWNTPGSVGDLNGDSTVNFADLDILLDRWGVSCHSASVR